MQYTQEQLDIIRRDVDPEEILKIIAFAGAGKTSTLYGYTEKRPNQKFLYVCFNKSVQVGAKKKFPKNTECRTSHSLAFAGFGSRYRHKLAPSLKANEVAEILGINDDLTLAKMAVDTLQNFIISSDKSITDRHLPQIAWRLLGPGRLSKCLTYAEDIWEMMCDVDNEDLGMTHDGYLKLYVLSGPILDFDCLLLDEAQDANEILVSFLVSQHKPLVLIGDPHQSIYSFRGAINVMDHIKTRNDGTYYLTHSFRFPQMVGDMANLVLGLYKNEKRQIKTDPSKPGKLRSVSQERHTLIARTNSELFVEATKLLDTRRIAFMGGAKGYRLDDLSDAYYLYAGKREKIRSPYIQGFESYKAMRDYANEVEDQEVISRCRVVDRFKSSIPVFVHRIKEASKIKEKEADVLLTTCHKSKGLEFSLVRMANDYAPLAKKGRVLPSYEVKPEEINLIYVALTRAMVDLELPPKMVEFIASLREERSRCHPTVFRGTF